MWHVACGIGSTIRSSVLSGRERTGRKINPLGFRLGITLNYHSNWFARPRSYAKYVMEDKRVRDCIDAYVHGQRLTADDSGDGAEGIARVLIRRKPDSLMVDIHAGSPAVLIKSHGRGIDQLRMHVLLHIMSDSRIGRVHITLVEPSEPYGEPNILAKYIGSQLGNRVAFRRTMKKAIEPARRNGRRGITIQIAGRLMGAEIARVEWAREGRVPLQTLGATIDYCYYPALTVYGVLGIKVWMCREE